MQEICYNLSMEKMKFEIPKRKISAFCKRWKITEFAIFGSALGEEFHAESDVDILVSFDSDAKTTLFDMVRMKDELEKIFERDVDLISKRGVEQSRNYLRKKSILDSAQVIYANA